MPSFSYGTSFTRRTSRQGSVRERDLIVSSYEFVDFRRAACIIGTHSASLGPLIFHSLRKAHHGRHSKSTVVEYSPS